MLNCPNVICRVAGPAVAGGCWVLCLSQLCTCLARSARKFSFCLHVTESHSRAGQLIPGPMLSMSNWTKKLNSNVFPICLPLTKKQFLKGHTKLLLSGLPVADFWNKSVSAQSNFLIPNEQLWCWCQFYSLGDFA